MLFYKLLYYIYYLCAINLNDKVMFRIKEIISEKGLTITGIAEKMGIAQPSLSNIINEKVTPSLDMLQRIADALEVDISELFINPNDNVFKCPNCGATLEVNKKTI